MRETGAADKVSIRTVAAAGIAIAGLGLAWLAGAPLAAALAALIGGALAMLAGRPAEQAAPPVSTPPPPAAPDADWIDAFDEPLLLARDRRVVAANHAAIDMLGDHILGSDVRLAIRHPAAAERLSDPDGAPGPVPLPGFGGAERRWEMAATRLSDDARLIRLIDRGTLHASEAMRVDFVANASHELRTPLATLLGFLETLQDDEAASDKKTRQRFVRIMFGEARRMQQLVNDLISLSRIEAERFSPPTERVDLRPLLDEVRQSCGQLIDERRSAVLAEFDSIEPIVTGDRAQLLQLLRNLVVNALKYGAEGTPVRVRFEAAGDQVRMRVIDQGEGIAPEHLPRLTERFYRADPSRSRAIGGTGLGLAIVKHIVGRHRGRLDIRSVLGEGTEVVVDLPPAPPVIKA